MNTSSHELLNTTDMETDSDEESVLTLTVASVSGQKKYFSFNYSARKKIEEYLDNKAIFANTYDMFGE